MSKYVIASKINVGDTLVTGAVRRRILNIVEMPNGRVIVTNNLRTHAMQPNEVVCIAV